MESDSGHRRSKDTLLRAFASVLQSQAHRLEARRPLRDKALLQLLVGAPSGSSERKRVLDEFNDKRVAVEDCERVAQLLRKAAGVLQDGTTPSRPTFGAVPSVFDTAKRLDEIADRLPAAPVSRPSGPIQRAVDRFFAECEKHPYRGEFEDALANTIRIEELTRLTYANWRVRRERVFWNLLEQLSDIAFDANQDLDGAFETMKDEMHRHDGEDIFCFVIDNVEVSAHPRHPLGLADLVAQRELSPYTAQNAAAEKLIADAKDAIERALQLRAHWRSNDLLAVGAILSGMHTTTSARPVRRRGRPSKNLATQRVLAELVKVSPPGSASEIAAVMTARYLTPMTDDEVRTELRNIETADKKRSQTERLLPIRERQKPGRIKGVKTSK